jgi:hypothetical protein
MCSRPLELELLVMKVDYGDVMVEENAHGPFRMN